MSLMGSREVLAVEQHANKSAAFTSLMILIYFDVFRLDGLLHPQILGLDMFQTARHATKQHGLACGCVPCLYQGTSPAGSSHFVQ